MRKVMLLVVSFVMLVMLAGVAYAATFNGTNGPDFFGGTDQKDIVFGFDGADILNGAGGPDDIDGGRDNDELNGGGRSKNEKVRRGADELYGGHGSDVLEGGFDRGSRDYLDGGPGFDRCNVGRNDVTESCEEEF